MSQYTYEHENNNTALETYEWDNVWWEQTAKSDAPRVLYIGDSISCNTRRIATAFSGGEMLFDGFGTSKALDNPYFFDSVRMFARQEEHRDAILFNNGLHGWHLDDDAQYPHLYEETVKFLLKEFGDTPLVILLTTSVADEEREERVKRRNKAATEIAAKYGLSVINLYTASVEAVELRTADGVHFCADGYKKLAEKIVGDLKKIILK